MVLSLVLATMLLTQTGSNNHGIAKESFLLSLQTGAGAIDQRPSMLALARLSYRNNWLTGDLRVPLWVHFEEALASSALDAESSTLWHNDWGDPETYASMVERLALRLPGIGLEISAGELRQESLGFGTLVDRYDNSLDPTKRRAGLKGRLELQNVDTSLMLDSVVRPSLVSLGTTLYPLRFGNMDKEGRFRVGLGGAADFRAPSVTGEKVTFGTELGLGYTFLKYPRWAIESYATANMLNASGFGTHWGFRFEYANPKGHNSPILTAQIEGVYAGRDYSPGYFGQNYSVERHQMATQAQKPKADSLSKESFYWRSLLDVQFGRARWGVGTTHNIHGRFSAQLYLKLRVQRLSAGLVILKQDMKAIRDLVEIGAGTHVQAETSIQLFGGMHLFASLWHGWRISTQKPLRQTTDWTLGIGYALQAAP